VTGEKRKGSIFEKIMAINLPNFMKNINVHIQKANGPK
jgi:hypothetical protein